MAKTVIKNISKKVGKAKITTKRTSNTISKRDLTLRKAEMKHKEHLAQLKSKEFQKTLRARSIAGSTVAGVAGTVTPSTTALAAQEAMSNGGLSVGNKVEKQEAGSNATNQPNISDGS